MKIIPPTPQPVADWSDAAELQRQLVEAVEEIVRRASDVGLARHILEYDGDRKKRALARAMAPALKGGDSAAKAEAEARASDTYGAELVQLGKEQQAAQTCCLEFDALKLRWETARSLLSMLKEQVRHV